MNFAKFFALAKEKGIEQSQIKLSKSSSLTIKLFHHEIDSYKVANSQSLIACGLYKGKLGFGVSQKIDSSSFSFLVDQIILTASYSEKPCEIGLFPGSPKYKKRNVYNKELSLIPVEKKIALVKELENAIYAADSRITDADDVTYVECEVYSEFYNSFGLKLKQKDNNFVIFAGAIAKDKGETKTFYDVFIDNDLSKFNVDKFAKSIVSRAVSKFGGAPCASNKYPTVLDKAVVSPLIGYYLTSTIADNVQRHSSVLEGKLNQKVASSKLTIEEKPLAKNLFYSFFDDEGVATQNHFIIKNGVLKTYLYNRETAAKDGVESTGNGAWGSGKFGTTFSNIFVKGGKASFDELISPIKEGVYITEIAGLGTGMNANSGNFSCQAEGYMIRDGKIAEPLNLITISGNLFKMFKDLKGFSNRTEIDDSAVSVGDAYIKSLSIGGK